VPDSKRRRPLARGSATSAIKRALRALARLPLLRRPATRLYLWRTRRRPGNREHPFDRTFGVRTSGDVPGFLLGPGLREDDQITGYLGCVPSVLRAALATIPDLDRTEFIDLGCGKGRALIVASEHPFRRIEGIELDSGMVRQARRNAARIRAAYPDRTPIEVAHGDASSRTAPPGDAVFFLFHPFGARLVRKLLDGLVATAGADQRLFLISENPVHGEVIDRHPGFVRWYAAMLPYAPEEVGGGPDDTEAVVVWVYDALGRAESPHPHEGLIVTARDSRAEIR
jgi:SAM-dependent methyltransferase